jgi:hypothetical protein
MKKLTLLVTMLMVETSLTNLFYVNASSSALASFRSRVSNPSANQL